jgi:hypothetical protein
MSFENVFFCRCRPQHADPIEIVVRERRVFIGWPAWRPGASQERDRMADEIVDFWCPDEEWNALYGGYGEERRHYQGNRNFVRKVGPGSIALVPRPSLGVVYAGIVTRRFEIEKDPPWADEYLALRRAGGLDTAHEAHHVADVGQCCVVDELRPISFPLFPAWIRRSLLGRSTYGLIAPMPERGLHPSPVVKHLIENPTRAVREWTSDPGEVADRLVDMVGPTTFEHLCVALLQLEHPDEIWLHVGGSGDGGVDGVGADANGRTVAILQCKWGYWGEPVFQEAMSNGVPARRILASLLHGTPRPPDEIEFLGLDQVAGLVLKHAGRLPIAVTLRVAAA